MLSFIFSLTLVSGIFAQNGERIYLKSVCALQKCDIWISKSDSFQKIEIPSFFWDKKGIQRGDGFMDMSRLLEGYFKQGYKLISSNTQGTFFDYILEKR